MAHSMWRHIGIMDSAHQLSERLHGLCQPRAQVSVVLWNDTLTVGVYAHGNSREPSW